MISTRELLARIVALERLLKCAVLNNNETIKIVISNTDTFIIPTETISGYDINLSEEFVNLVNSKLPKPTEEYSPSFDKVVVIDSNGLTSTISINELGEDNIIESISVNGQVILPFDKNVNIETITKHSELDLDDGTNPHGTTKMDVGLGNVDNTSDLNKPVSIDTQNALDTKLDKNTSVTADTMMYIKNPDGTQGITPINHRVLLLDTNTDGSISTQGVTGTVVLKTYNIPMSLLRKNGIFRISARMAKTEGVESLFTTSVYFGTTSEQFPFNIISSSSATNKYISATRDVKSIYNSSLPYFTMTSFNSGGGYYTGWLAHANIPRQSNVYYDTEYLPARLVISTTSATDKIVLDYLMIEFLSE